MEGPNAMQHIGGAVISTLFHPIGYAKILIQLGHEPLAPYPTKTIFRNDALIYPNVFKYVAHIRATDGFFGCYRGVVPRLLGGVVTSVVQQAVAESFPPEEEDETPAEDGGGVLVPIKAVCIKASKETIAKGVAIIASQPLHVIMVRSMAQFVGGEGKYSSLTSAIGEIYNNDGILGFFAGLVPRLIGEALTVWLANILAHLMNTYLVEDKGVQCYTGAACGMVVTQLTYPFSLVSNLMAAKGSGLVATTPPQMPVYDSWIDCWTQLSQARQLKRGSNMFFRYFTGPFTVSGGRMMALDYAFNS